MPKIRKVGSPVAYMEKTSDVAETAVLAKKIGGKFGLKMG